MTEIQDAQSDTEMFKWLQNVIHGDSNQGIAPAGDFLRYLANAAIHADWENYPILRPVLLQMRYKYPQYNPKT